MIISKRELKARFYRAYWSVRAQRHLHELPLRDPSYTRQQIDVLMHFVEDCVIEGRDPGEKWIANSPPPREEPL